MKYPIRHCISKMKIWSMTQVILFLVCATSWAQRDAAKPDLRLNYIELDPIAPIVDAETTILARIYNAGNVDCGSYKVKYYVDDQEIGSLNSDGLGSHEAESLSIVYLFKESGAHVVKVVVDGDNAVDELLEDNNTKETSVYANELKPDLFCGAILYSNGPTVGEPTTISVLIMNSGNAASGPFNVKFLVDKTEIGIVGCEGLDYSIGSVAVSIGHTFVNAGEHTVKIIVNCDNAIDESDETNNEKEDVVTVKEAPTADLLIRSISLSPESPIINQTASFTAELVNQGSADSGLFNVKYYVDGQVIGTSRVKISARETLNDSIIHTFTQAGTYTLKVVVDCDETVVESKESNNSKEKEFVVSESDGKIELAFGSVIPLTNETLGIPMTSANPKLEGTYTQPTDSKIKTARLSTLNKSQNDLYAIWNKIIKLYNKKDLVGKQFSAVLDASPAEDVEISLSLNGERIPRYVVFKAPVILQMTLVDGTLTIDGQFFGSKTPKVLVEFEQNGKWKYKKCKIDQSSYHYKNARGKSNSSCMKIYSDDENSETVGFSQIIISDYPPKLPPNAAASGYIIVDNGCGMVAYKLTEE